MRNLKAITASLFLTLAAGAGITGCPKQAPPATPAAAPSPSGSLAEQTAELFKEICAADNLTTDYRIPEHPFMIRTDGDNVAHEWLFYDQERNTEFAVETNFPCTPSQLLDENGENNFITAGDVDYKHINITVRQGVLRLPRLEETFGPQAKYSVFHDHGLNLNEMFITDLVGDFKLRGAVDDGGEFVVEYLGPVNIDAFESFPLDSGEKVSSDYSENVLGRIQLIVNDVKTYNEAYVENWKRLNEKAIVDDQNAEERRRRRIARDIDYSRARKENPDYTPAGVTHVLGPGASRAADYTVISEPEPTLPTEFEFRQTSEADPRIDPMAASASGIKRKFFDYDNMMFDINAVVIEPCGYNQFFSRWELASGPAENYLLLSYSPLPRGGIDETSRCAYHLNWEIPTASDTLPVELQRVELH